MRPEPRFQCCFCGGNPPPEDYVELVVSLPLGLEGTGPDPQQTYGAHMTCFKQRLGPRVPFELEELAGE